MRTPLFTKVVLNSILVSLFFFVLINPFYALEFLFQFKNFRHEVHQLSGQFLLGMDVLFLSVIIWGMDISFHAKQHFKVRFLFLLTSCNCSNPSLVLLLCTQIIFIGANGSKVDRKDKAKYFRKIKIEKLRVHTEFHKGKS